MVSRKHAEFRLQTGRCLVADTNSRFGTFVNGEKVSTPVEVRVGAHVQLGAGGPILRVISIEQTAKPDAQNPSDLAGITTLRESQEAKAAEVLAPKSSPLQEDGLGTRKKSAPLSDRPPENQLKPAVSNVPAYVELFDSDTGQAKRIHLDREVTRLGRAPDNEVLIDADAAVVSRHHAEIRKSVDQFTIVDLKSFNGTLVNGQRIAGPATLFGGDQIQLGVGGPVLRLIDQAHPAPPQRQVQPGVQSSAQPSIPPEFGQIAAMARRETIVVSGTATLKPTSRPSPAEPQLLARLSFDNRAQLSIGRAPDNDIRLDGLQISNHHARFALSNANVTVEDTGSTNGVYVNGERISGRRQVQLSDVIQIGPFVLQGDTSQGVAVYDTRSKTRIDGINIVKMVPNRAGGGTIKLLDDIGLTIQPNEFVGLLGPSGAGKSTLMDALNGMRPASSGFVLINNLDLYRHLDSLKQSMAGKSIRS